jgi:thiamine biosynthesis lipoprotein
VSVLHPDGAYADGIATALFVLGSEAGYPLAQRQNLSVLFVSRVKDRFVTRGTGVFADSSSGQTGG